MTVPVSIPRYPDDVTADWLAGVLDADVSDVEVTAVGTGQTGATYRVAVDYAANPGALPDTFVIKLPAADDAVRDRVVFGYRSQCAFYARWPTGCRCRSLRSITVTSPRTPRNYALLLSDQVPATQGDRAGRAAARRRPRWRRPPSPGCTAPPGTAGNGSTFPGLPMSTVSDEAKEGARLRRGHERRHHRRELGAKLSATDGQTFVEAMSLVTPWLQNDFGRFSLIHGDYRLDNMLFHPDGKQIWVVDWRPSAWDCPHVTCPISPRPAWNPTSGPGWSATWWAIITLLS